MLYYLRPSLLHSPDTCPADCPTQNDSNSQVQQLNLKDRFRVVQSSGAVSPSELRRAWQGPLLFTTTGEPLSPLVLPDSAYRDQSSFQSQPPLCEG